MNGKKQIEFLIAEIFSQMTFSIQVPMRYTYLKRPFIISGFARNMVMILAGLLAITSASQAQNANFTSSDPDGCSPLLVQFINLSTTPGNPANLTYAWDFGNGNTSVFPNPIATYVTPGTYTVRLTIRDAVTGISSTMTRTNYVTVFSNPSADFTSDVVAGCAPLPVQFNDNSSAGSAAIVSWSWDFGDGTLGSGPTPNHTYTGSGVYNVTLVTVDANGCQNTEIKSNYINVSSVASLSFTASPTVGCTAPMNVTFSPAVSPAGLYTYLWDFGDGSTSTQANPVHSYNSSGNFTVRLTIQDALGCQETYERVNYIQIQRPTADFSAVSTSGCTGQAITFLNNSTNGNTYFWNFGNGQTSTQANPTHVYAATGNYTVTLTVTNAAGCTDFIAFPNYITINQTPDVNFTSPNRTGCAVPLTVDFLGTSTYNIATWAWAFGDGNSANSQITDNTYTAPGQYNVSLTITATNGCQANVTKNAYVQIIEPVADFATSRQQGCVPLTVNFVDLSTAVSPITNWFWDFGDGSISTAQNPTHVYTTPGQYTVTLRIRTAAGCEDIYQFQYIEAGNLPVANFIANPRLACVGADVNFSSLSTGNVTNWQWNFGDGTGSNAPNPVHQYQDTGFFAVTLVVSEFGCSDTLSIPNYVQIRGAVADFAVSTDQGCNPPVSINFFDQSLAPDTWFWDFGDGTTSTVQNPAHVYTTTGTFTVNLTVQDTVLGCVSQFQDQITIRAPRASFTASATLGCVGSGISFTNFSTDANTWLWDFGDGATSTAGSPSHTFNQPGKYVVTLTASDGVCAHTYTLPDTVVIGGPSPDFVASALTGCAPLSVTFSDLSTPFSGTTITSWLWDFGDGGSSTLPSPTYVYNTPGIFTVTLRVLDNQGCLNTISKNSYINPTFPNANFNVSSQVACPGTLVNFTSTSTGTGISYLWNFGDGTSSNFPNPTKLYPGPGMYSVTLTVTDVNGCSDVEIKNNFINISVPTANFNANVTSATCPPLSVSFTNLSSPNVVSWYWDFGDGTTSILPNPSKIYTIPGDFDVMLIVTSGQGCTDTMRISDFIQISGPTGSFDMTPKEGCKPLLVNFAVNSPDPSYTYTWDFGDGSGGSGITTSHTFTTDTTARPILLIRDASGCQVGVRSPDSINIRALPKPSFTVNWNTICLGETVSFTNTSTSRRPIVGVIWDFGNGITSTSLNPTYTYTETGTYYVNLLLTTLDGCSDTLATPVAIRVTAPPTALFVATPSASCEPASISFTQSSTGYFPLVTYDWDFGDGSTSLGAIIPAHTYINAGIYTASLTVTDTRGCTGNQSRSVEAYPLPNTDFSAPRYGCAPISIQFTDLTTSSAPATAWLWTFGDGSTSTLKNPSHTYLANGQYAVSLTVTDSRGCVRQINKNNYIVLRSPNASFTSNAVISCPPVTVNFTNTSTIDTTSTYLWSFGDGATSTAANPSHVYTGEGSSYTVRLIVTNIFGCTDTIVLPNHVQTYARPTAGLTVNTTAGCAPLSISASSTSTPGSGALSSYLWSFGNGVTQSGSTGNYQYNVPGTYTLSLITTDVNGCRDTASTPIQVFGLPKANFRAADSIGCAIENISFFSLSTGPNPIATYQWTFGDGNTGIGQNPVNTYLYNGNYTVKMSITDINGCKDSLTKSNYIRLARPTANFSINRSTICPGQSIAFRNLSTGPRAITQRFWDFGDGGTSTSNNPTYVYNTPGTYTVTLRVTDGIACSDTLIRTNLIRVQAPPTASFTDVPPFGCSPLGVSFTNTSIPGGSAVASLAWNFGDGGTALVPNPTYLYNTAGTYTVVLTATDANGCTDTAQSIVNAFATPVVDFIASTRVGCAPQGITFSDLTTTPYVKTGWLWSFGDGTTSTAQGPTHVYTSDGTFTVKLVVTDQNGCKDSLTKTQYIRLRHPVANFTNDQSVVCPGTAVGVQFTDISTPDTTLSTWAWSFGDGLSSIAQNPNHSYAGPGTYSVTLVVTNVLGCKDTVVKTSLVSVLNPPVADFDMDTTADCAPLRVVFTDRSVNGDGVVVSWAWDFGDGTTSLAKNPTKTWTIPGVYKVRLIVTDANGCIDSLSANVTARQLPVANFMSADTFGCAPRAVSFINTSTGATAINYWKWYFGDGDSTTMVSNPVHTYQNDGVYTVTLIIRDANGCGDTIVRPNYIRLTHPSAAFTYNTSVVCPGIPIGVTFTDQSVADHPLTSWAWDFGNGQTSTLQNPSHSYANSGVYTVRLIVTNQFGCKDTSTVNAAITVLNPPLAAFNVADPNDCVPFAASFTNASVAGSAPIVNWNWNFGNGATSLVPSPNYTYTTPGVYTVLLTVTDNNGCIDTASRSVQAFALPNADFVATDTVGCPPASITFVGSSTAAAAITGRLWDFGDGGTGSTANPTHIYNANGLYSVGLIITDANGCKDTTVKPSYIRITAPVADFSADQTSGCPGFTVNFTDNSTPDHPLTNWLWDFGDGLASTQQNPAHVYTSPGVYTVTLTVTNAIGCTSVRTRTNYIRVFTPPTAGITPVNPSSCTPAIVDFNNNSTNGSGGISAWNWNFGNGQTTTAVNPIPVTYPTAGTYVVTLTVTDVNGCSSTTTTQVTAFAQPTAGFVANETLGCAPKNITFTDQTVGPASAVAWEWNFGDGGSSTLRNPTHTYAANGVYDVRLIVVDANGCRDTLFRPQYIKLREPVANFSVANAQGCSGLAVQFTDLSVVDTTITNWTWDFGDGTTSASQNPTHTYLAAGFYTVSLRITDVVGCSDIEVKASVVRIFPSPTAQFSVNDSIGCAPFSVAFTNLSVGNGAPLTGRLWDFGTGATSALNNPVYTFSTPGIYTVTLSVTDLNGCTSLKTRTIRVMAPPVASFFTNTPVSCPPATVSFVNTSTGTSLINGFLWDFGDGTTSNLPSPSHVYTSIGVYSVTLIVYDQFGCSDTMTRTQYIDVHGPDANFSMDKITGCPGVNIQFSDLSTSPAGITGWAWDFGDGFSANTQNPSHTFASPGLYTVRLIVTDANGCQDVLELVDTISVLTPPVAAYTVPVTEGCNPLTLTFTDASTSNTSSIVAWSWDFGDGGGSLVKNPTHIFSMLGDFSVGLTVTDANGCTGYFEQDISVLAPPVANFNASKRFGCAPTPITFTSTTTSSYPIATYKWYFGDGDSASTSNPTHTYASNGVYAVTLIVTDIKGCTSSLSRNAFIVLRSPVAQFSSDKQNVCPGEAIQFSDLSVADTTLISWQWEFGDGSTSTQRNPLKTYLIPGTYTVRLTITNALACTDEEQKIAYIRVATRPDAQFTPSALAGCTPFSLTLTNNTVANTNQIAGYQWTFGNGLSSTLPNPSVTYNTPGVYPVMLVAIDQNGCSDTATLSVEAYRLPVAKFKASDSTGCAPKAITFIDQSVKGSGNIISYVWNFGDGGSSTAQFPTHTYANNGVYTVSLTVTDANGCSNTYTYPNYIRLTEPVANFSADKTQICPGEVVSFTDLSMADTTLTSWTWDFGDGASSSAQNPTHAYAAAGQYTVTLTVRNLFNCSDVEVKTQYIRVLPGPAAEFTPSALGGCTPFQAFFTDQSIPNGFPIVSWYWEFGDGTFATVRNPSKTYNTPGNYAVSLMVTDSRGCTGTIVKNVQSYVLPLANFQASDTVGCPQTISFADLSLSPYAITSWTWSFGDGDTSSQQNPVHTYVSTGTYTVRLDIVDEHGCISTITRTNYIRVTRPVAAFLQDQDVICPGGTVSFFDTSIPDYPLINWEWDFGDGTTGTGLNQNHTFLIPGLYTVSLTVTNNQGCKATTTATVEVVTPPVASFNFTPAESCVPAPVTFTDASLGTSSNLIFWVWSLGDGTVVYNQNTTHTYTVGGNYAVSLLVIDGNGCTDDTVQTMVVNPLPVVNFVADDSVGCAPKSVRFTDRTVSAQPIVSWLWDFGDGTSATQQNPTHFYGVDGLYTVKLTIIDAKGCTSSKTKTQYIRLRHPVASFFQNTTTGCPPLTVAFTNTSVPDTTVGSWFWSFGDGQTSTLKNPVHIYDTPGSYSVSMIITNIFGCADTVLKPGLIKVQTPAVANFTSPDTVGCVPFTTSFVNTSIFTTAPIVSYSWNFGDGGTSTNINPVHTFQDPGTYFVQLTITDANGCTSRKRMQVLVNDLPQPAFTTNGRTGCAPKQISFTDQSFSLYPIVAWQWNFGDGNFSTQQFPVHVYNTNGVYDITLTVDDINGCTNTLVFPQYIRLLPPVADFTVDDSATCVNNAVQFTDLSVSDTTLVTWDWDFGDGNTSTQRNPNHTYTATGLYTVTLRVTDVEGCEGVVVKTDTVHVLPGPTPSFAGSTLQGCAPLTITFTNTTVTNGSPIVNWNWDFGDGGNSIFTNPQHTFTTPGTYTVTLYATDSKGCTNPYSVTVTVFSVPQVLFTSNQRFGCTPATIQFLDQTTPGTGPIVNWLWDFGDGSTSTQQFATHVYTTDGDYNVSLMVTDINGCSDRLDWPRYIQLSHPVAAFSVSDTMICPNTSLNFIDESVPDTTIMAWTWSFGDGTSSNLRNPVHTYTAAGLYNVSLTVTNVLGCSHTLTRNTLVRVLDGPTANFSLPIPYGCTPFNAVFTDQSVANSAPIVSWFWEFGDGTTSAARNPNHTYTTPGVFTVRLTVTDNRGCPQSITRTVEALRLPIANFLSTDTLGCAVHTAAFADLTIGTNPITGWTWDFGDGTSSAIQSPVHDYLADGLYTVSLIAIDYYGCRDTLTKPNYVRLTSPTPQFNVVNGRGCPGIRVEFQDNTIADTTLVSWYWTFGDGTFSVARNPFKTYNVPGNYTVTLTVRNINGCERTVSVPNAVRVSQPPLADFVPTDSTGCEPFTVTISDATQAFTSPVVAWYWDFGNGDSSRVQDPTYTFYTPGNYNVRLRIVDANGCPAETTKVLRTWVRPTAAFMTPDTIGCAPHLSQFTDLSTGPVPMTGWNWTFGDGGTAANQFPLYTYQSDGLYSVGMVVTDLHGCKDTAFKPLYIRLRRPVAQFTAAVRNGCEGTVVTFNNTTIADTTIVGWLWDFGDGTQSNLKSPVKSYGVSGSYDVMLVATNILGCRDTMIMRNFVRIYEPPTAVFTATDTSRCEPFLATFTDWSTSPYGVATWEWTVDDSIPKGTGQSMSHFFPAVGSYKVKLKVTDANGCVDSLVKTVYVRPIPQANFVASDTLSCAPIAISFRDLSFHVPTQWSWDFGDGGTATDQFPVHQYVQDGTYSVKLTIVDVYGCTDNITKLNYIRLDHPNADFVVDYRPGCPPVKASFVAEATSNAGIAGYTWTFGDGYTGFGREAEHIYRDPGLYTVTLVVIDSVGCRDTVTKVDLVNALLDKRPQPLDIYYVSVLEDRKIEIRFAKTEITDFREYTIYREKPGVGYVPIYTTQYLNDTVFIDQGVNARDSSYCYKVTATNFCGTEGDIAATLGHCTVELRSTPIPGQIVLQWNSYVGWDVAAYEIYSVKSYSTLNPDLIATVPGFTNRFNHILLNCFTDHSYRIKAVGYDPMQTSWSDTSRTFNANRIVGDPEQMLRATVENNQYVLVEWEPIKMEGLQFIYIDKISERNPTWTTVANLLPGEVKFIDSANVNVMEESYGYRVHAEDTCGNSTPITGRIAKSINLHAARADSSRIRLEWTRYQEWLRDVLRYRIELYNEALDEWVLVKIVNSTTDTVYYDPTPYVDATRPWEQTSYCYRIWADEKGGNTQISLSNEDCVDIPPGIFAPNAFTPNGDGINERFLLKGVYAETFNMKVFSRWGLLLFETNDIDEGWNGTFKGEPVAEGVYVFVATGRGYNGKPFTVKGSITLIR